MGLEGVWAHNTVQLHGHNRLELHGSLPRCDSPVQTASSSLICSDVGLVVDANATACGLPGPLKMPVSCPDGAGCWCSGRQWQLSLPCSMWKNGN